MNIWNMKLGQHGVAKLLAQQSSQPRNASGQLQALSYKLSGQGKALQCHRQSPRSKASGFVSSSAGPLERAAVLPRPWRCTEGAGDQTAKVLTPGAPGSHLRGTLFPVRNHLYLCAIPSSHRLLVEALHHQLWYLLMTSTSGEGHAESGWHPFLVQLSRIISYRGLNSGEHPGNLNS